MSNTTRIRLRTKHGRPFRRFGKVIGPEEFTEFDVTDAELKALKPDCAPLDQGGVLALEVVGPTPKEKPPATGDKSKA